MLDSIKRWLAAAPAEGHAWPELAAWAKAQQWTLRPVREIEGFVIDGRFGATPWRLEWGPSQRPYITGQELRLRADLELPRELQALVLNRELMEAMERSVFDQYVEGVQTRIDTTTPPEMRWLVMLPRLSNGEMMALRERWAAVSGFKPWLQQWLGGELSKALVALPTAAAHPLVLIVARRRLSLRTSMPVADLASLKPWLHLYERALREAMRIAVEDLGSGTPSTQPSLFPASTLPVEARG